MHLQYNSDKDFYISFNFTPVRKHIVSFLSIILNVLTNHMHTNVSLRLSYIKGTQPGMNNIPSLPTLYSNCF
jgi:hypothetical protein